MKKERLRQSEVMMILDCGTSRSGEDGWCWKVGNEFFVCGLNIVAVLKTATRISQHHI